MLTKLGHIGFWAGLYALAALVCFWQLVQDSPSESPIPRWDSLLVVLFTATAIYALDRVKLRDAWIDPADRLSQPRRYEFLSRNSTRIRFLAAALLVTSAAIGIRINPWMPLIMLLAVFGICAYALRPRGPRRRVKDVLWVKNLYVAVGMTGFVALVTHAASRPMSWPSQNLAVRLVIAAIILAVRIALDAAMCDIDDELADRQFGTNTFVTVLGRRRAWIFTGLARLVLIAGLLVATPLAWPSRLAWAITMVAGMAALRIPRWENLREPVDLRFVPEAALATALLLLQSHI